MFTEEKMLVLEKDATVSEITTELRKRGLRMVWQCGYSPRKFLYSLNDVSNEFAGYWKHVESDVVLEETDLVRKGTAIPTRAAT